MKFGDVVKIKTEKTCPLVGHPKGTIGVITNIFEPSKKYYIATEFNRTSGYYGWWYFEDELEFLGKNVAYK